MARLQPHRRRLAAALLLATLSLTSLAAQLAPPSLPSLTVDSVTTASNLHFDALERRHGVHEEHEELKQEPHAAAANASSSSSAAQTSSPPHHDHHSPPSLPSATSQHELVPIPVLQRTSGHSHGHGGEAPLPTLNETKIFWAKGPDALSYIEYDLAYGLGTTAQLRRFTNAAVLSGYGEGEELMGFIDGRWRKLLDEVDVHERQAVIGDLQSRLKDDAEPARHTTLLLIHVVGCIVSCFILLPVSLALRAASSKFAPLASLTYLAVLLASLLASGIYKARTPKLYPSSSHGTLGWIVFWLSLVCLGGDLVTLTHGVMEQLCSTGGSAGHRLRAFISSLAHTSKSKAGSSGEEVYMLSEEPSSTHHVHFSDSEPPSRQASGDSSSPSSTLCGTPRVSTTAHGSFSKPNYQRAKYERSSSPASTLPKKHRRRAHMLRVALRYTHVVVARSLPILAFAGAYTGLAVYTGSCRAGFKNVCLAHGIKGGIFLWYGLITFARFLGAYADIGWAWNKRPSPRDYMRSGGAPWRSNVPSAEWVECLVCLAYGASNAFMERFGAQPGDAWTVKQLQHVGIAVMFAGAGAVGLILETRWVRDLLSFPVALSHPSARDGNDEDGEVDLVGAQAQPPSYQGSFNPFPALVIGITGVAMAAHHQDYVYEVEIHKLWGNLLAGFAVFRCLTYFFLWLRPPTSILPSRPPTEALASFCLTAGGLVFMLSSEEVSFAAMRNGYGDMMAVLNVAVAVVALVFAWIALLLLLKAAAVRCEARKHAGGPDSRARRYAARIRNRSYSGASTAESVFVLGEDLEDGEPGQPSRHLSASPIEI